MVKGKRGWIRIVEAFIAILLVTGVMLYLYNTQIGPSRRAEQLYNFQKTILDEIALNDVYRTAVLAENEETIHNFVASRMVPGFEFKVRICDVGDICGLSFYEEELYSSDRIISATLETFEPKKVKIFMWRER
jgi:hypothetical protein